jgi:SAM-dependent methyltransferase
VSQPDDAAWSSRRNAFGAQAAAYATGRPGYPAEAVQWALPPGATRVLDLAAGTGRMTERLLELGLDVVAVEPDAAMRAHVPAAAESLDGTAEAIPLADKSVDAVLVGTAFHWFDIPKAMVEIHRVLRPGGMVGLFWNLLDDTLPDEQWVRRFCDILDAEARVSVVVPDQGPPYGDVAGMSEPQRQSFPHRERYDVERLVTYVSSWSQTILLPDDRREERLAEIRAVAPGQAFDLPLVCEGWRGERTD